MLADENKKLLGDNIATCRLSHNFLQIVRFQMTSCSMWEQTHAASGCFHKRDIMSYEIDIAIVSYKLRWVTFFPSPFIQFELEWSIAALLLSRPGRGQMPSKGNARFVI